MDDEELEAFRLAYAVACADAGVEPLPEGQLALVNETLAGNLHASEIQSDPSAESRDWVKLRKAKPAEQLLPMSKKLLDELPDEVFPNALATQYARIVNLIALQWNDRSSGDSYFNELLTDQRGGRQGFPAPVKRDLLKLRTYWHLFGPRLEGGFVPAP